ncbi:hypothetical protein KA005_21845, partial [bacterium]|nr:hypothetical protein [bacterium]
DYDGFFKAVPYAKHAISAYKWYRNRRIALFFKSIDAASDSLPQKDKEKFEEYINSKPGREILAEYTDSILRTSSDTGIAALGILYADVNNEIYTHDFKRIACRAFEGATDALIDGFILLCSLEIKPEEGPYPLCHLTKGQFESGQRFEEKIGTAEDVFALINELVRRGMLLPDHVPSRISGEQWFINYGVTEVSLKLKELIMKAKSYLET